MNRIRRTATYLAGSFSLIAVLGGSAPLTTSGHGTALARTIPAASFHTLAGTSRREFLAYATTLRFDTSYHASETRQLLMRTGSGSLKAGPVATVSPEIGVRATTVAEMGTGRIVARVTASGDFPSQGFAKGDNYIWIEKINGELRASVVPANAEVATKSFAFRVKHTGMNGGKVEARLRWDEKTWTNVVWVACDQGCCEMSMGDR